MKLTPRSAKNGVSYGGVKVSTGVISKGCMPRSGWLVKQSGTFLNADNYNYALAA